MKDFTARYPNREMTLMFYADADLLRVDEVQAFVCDPNSKDGIRWVPEKGYSCNIGYSLFNTRREANAGLMKMARKELPEAIKRLQDLQKLLSPKPAAIAKEIAG